MAPPIKFKDSSDTSKWLEAALESEWRKYASNPIHRDFIAEFNYAQAWGSIVAGYFLLEQSLKALLHKCGYEIGKTHVLYCLFSLLPDKQKNILRLHYSDFVKSFPGLGKNTSNDIDGYLKNLDGNQSNGSFSWRYFLIEEPPDNKLPFIEINLIHEIVYSICAVHREYENADYKHDEDTYSARLAHHRRVVFLRWYEERKCSGDWTDLGDRIEVLWGPNYADRYSYVIINGDQISSCFGMISENLKNKFVVHDVRDKFQSFQERKAIEGERNSDEQAIQFFGKVHGHLMF